MALQGWIPVLPFVKLFNSSPSAAFYQLTSTRTKIASVFRAPRSGSITHVKIRTGNITTTADLTVGLYNVDSGGNPTGTALGSGTIASPTANTVYEVTLFPSVSVTIGDWLAVVVEHNGSGNLYLASGVALVNTYSRTPYDVSYNSGAWTTRNAHLMLCSLRYGTDGYVPSGLMPVISSIQIPTYNSSSSPNEYGNKLVLPFPARIWGILCEHVFSALGGYRLNIYDAAGNELSSTAGGNEIPANYQFDNDGWVLVWFHTPIDVGAGTYYVTKLPTSTTNVKGRTVIYPSDSELQAGLWGVDIHQVTRTGGGSWTESNDRHFNIFPILSAFDNAAGGGGSVAGFPFPPHIVLT